MKLIVLGNPNGWYVREIIRAADKHRVSHQVASWDDISASVTDQASSITSQLRLNMDRLDRVPRPVCLADTRDEGYEQPDVVLVRNMPIGSLEQTIFRMNALAGIQRRGVRVVNSAVCLERSIDKWLTLELLSGLGLPVPRTIACQTRIGALEAFEELGGQSCVVKPVFGGEGRGILRVDSVDLAWRVFTALEQTRSIIYLQEFLGNHPLDLRFLFVGKKIYCIRRRNQNDWRQNTSRGAISEPFTPTPRQIELARKAAEAMQGYFVGVDILSNELGDDRILEVNGVPGWKGVNSALGIDVAEKLLESLISE